MSTITRSVQPTAGPDGPISIDQYEKLVETGVLTKRDKVQLIDGMLVPKMVQNPPHSVANVLCGGALTRIIPADWHMRAAMPVRLPPKSEPEPDHCVVRGTARDYLQRHPEPKDVGLLVEVADKTRLAANQKMTRKYGANGIPVYWIVNLVDNQVEVYTNPTADGYGPARIYKPGENVPVMLDRTVVGHIAVSDILP
jgi:Uma2 family endonuclease